VSDAMHHGPASRESNRSIIIIRQEFKCKSNCNVDNNVVGRDSAIIVKSSAIIINISTIIVERFKRLQKKWYPLI